MIGLLVLALLQEATTADLLRLAQEGATEEALLEKVGKTVFNLSAGEVVELRKGGLSEKVLLRLVEGPRDILLTNLAHKPLGAAVRHGVLEVSTSGSLAPGQSVQLPGGVLRVSVDGVAQAVTVQSPATLTLRGCDLDGLEVVTLVIDHAPGSVTCLVEVLAKEEGCAAIPPPIAAPSLRGGLLNTLADTVPDLIGSVTDWLLGF